MLIVVNYSSPGEIEPWEAWVTLAYMPIFVLHAYLVDYGCKCCKKKKVEDEEGSQDHIRIMTHQQRRGSFAGHATAGKELHMLEMENNRN